MSERVDERLLRAYLQKDDVAFDAALSEIRSSLSDVAAITRLLNEWDEFGKVYDPECHLPPVAERVHGVLSEVSTCE